MVFEILHAIGAYGRKANVNDWVEGKDFYSLDHNQYFSIRDIDALRADGYIRIDFVDLLTVKTLFSEDL